MVDRDALEMGDVAAGVLGRILPPRELQKLLQFRAEKNDVLLLRNDGPLDLLLPPTPVRGFGDDTKVQILDVLLMGVFQLTGFTPVAFEFENMGRLMRNVVPNPDSKGERSSHGYDEPLGWHIDDPCGHFEGAFTPCILRTPVPRVLGFVCLRNCDRWGMPVSTDVLPLATAEKYLKGEAFRAMQKPAFQVNPPASNQCDPLRGVPLVECIEGRQFYRFNSDAKQVFGLTEEAIWALSEFKKALERAEGQAFTFDLTPGSVLLFDNYCVAHRRKAFDPGENLGQARWLRRCFGLTSAFSGRYIDRTSWPYVVS